MGGGRARHDDADLIRVTSIARYIETTAKSRLRPSVESES